jgi:hypothetical protein
MRSLEVVAIEFAEASKRNKLGRANLCSRSLARKLATLRYELRPRVRVGNCGCFCKTWEVHSPEGRSRHLRIS